MDGAVPGGDDAAVHNHLLAPALGTVVDALRSGAGEEAWAEADKALRLARPDDPELDDSDLAVIVELRDLDELGKLVDGWRAGTIDRPAADKAILKRAMKALRKRVKLARLDEESTLGGTGLSSGRESAICGVRPPDQYPQEIWETLLRMGRVRDAGHGLLEPVGE